MAGREFDRERFGLLGLQQGDARDEIDMVEAADTAACAIGVLQGDIIDAFGDLRMQQAGVGEQDAVGTDVRANAGGEQRAELVPDTHRGHGAGDARAEAEQAPFFGGGFRRCFRHFDGHGQQGRQEVGVPVGFSLGSARAVEEQQRIFVLVEVDRRARCGQGGGVRARRQRVEHSVGQGKLFGVGHRRQQQGGQQREQRMEERVRSRRREVCHASQG